MIEIFGTKCHTLKELTTVITNASTKGLLTTSEMIGIYNHQRNNFPPFNGQPIKGEKVADKKEPLSLYTIKERIQYLEDISETQVYLADLIKKAKEAYYFSGEVLLDDETYDAVEEILRDLNPNHSILSKVGA